MERRDPNKKKKPNIFALITNNRQDRSYYKSLYEFNSNVELAEYSLPILTDEKEPEEDKMQPGSVNLNGVQVRMGTGANKLDPISTHSRVKDIIEEGEEEGEGEEDYGEGEGEMDMEEDENASLNSELLDQMVNSNEDQIQKEMAQAMNNMKFIEKDTPLYRQRAEIKTGEQAISFFAKHGNNTPIKIFN